MNILFAASEAVPYAASGGLADVAGTLPKVISEKGNNCAVVIPLYKDINPELRKYMNFLTKLENHTKYKKKLDFLQKMIYNIYC